ncbi:hypothetical protein FACS1894166_00840 [Bacilli bacterium]|nr:hypothetical protein FACS1894166_00840 [Bacilli bacterium]
MSKSTKSLAYNTAKKRKIIIGCAIGGTAVLMMGAGIGIGYAIKQTTKQDTISFGDYRSALNVGDQETISPVSSIGKHFTINATGSQPDN